MTCLRHAFGLKLEGHLRRTRDHSRVARESLFAVKWERMKPTWRPRVSLVTETGLFLWMSSPLISGGRLLSLRCSALVRYCLRLLMRVMDWCVSLLVMLICCRIILTASSQGRLLICRSPAILQLILLPRSGEVRRLMLDLDPYGGTDPLGMFPLFLKRTAEVMAPILE